MSAVPNDPFRSNEDAFLGPRAPRSIVLVGHLPVMSGLWLSQFASRETRRVPTVCMLRLEHDAVQVELFRVGPQRVGLRAQSTLPEALRAIALNHSNLNLYKENENHAGEAACYWALAKAYAAIDHLQQPEIGRRQAASLRRRRRALSLLEAAADLEPRLLHRLTLGVAPAGRAAHLGVWRERSDA